MRFISWTSNLAYAVTVVPAQGGERMVGSVFVTLFYSLGVTVMMTRSGRARVVIITESVSQK